TRVVFWGICLPEGCSPGDSREVVQIASAKEKNEPSHIEVINSRVVPGGYALWNDSTFILLIVFSFFILLLICIGTLVDFSEYKNPGNTAALTMGDRYCNRFTRNSQIPSVSRRSALRSTFFPRIKKGVVTFTIPHNVFSFFILLLICIGTLVDFSEYKNPGNTAALTMGDRYCNRFTRNSQIPSVSRRSALRSTLKEVMLCFSLARNATKIMNGSEEESREQDASTQGSGLKDRERFSCLHGIRFFSLAWIIGGHTCYISILFADNKHFRGVTERDFLYQTIANSPYAVDSFFFISGLLLAYNYFKSTSPRDVPTITPSTPTPPHPSKSVGKCVIRFCGLLIYRILRLTPPYLFIIGVLEVANKQYRSDSVFDPSNDDDITCARYWWRNILYINTLFPAKEMCMLWSWYLSDDTQFYIIGLTLLTIASSHFNFAAFFTVTLLLSSWISTGFMALEYGYTPRISEPLALFDELYDKPWTRVGPFIIGLAAGWMLYVKNCKINMNKGTTLIGWMISMTIFFILIYELHGRTIGPIASAFYAVFSHSAWGFGILWLVVVCATGKGGWINNFLSWKPLAPFSRISYCAYLVHPIVIRASVSQIDSPLHASRDSFIFLYCGHLIISYLLAFAVSVTLEAPIISLLKIFFRRIDNLR
ncbi:hypothetical protein J437_LFUL002105, partial [Ladona fulva]